MTNKDNHGAPSASEGRWSSRWLRFLPACLSLETTMNASGSSRRPSGILARSLRDDYPLWIASIWILWKQQMRDRKGISADSFLPAVRTKADTVNANDQMGMGSSSMIDINLLVDWVVLGTLLIYKKSREENKSHRRNDNDGNDDGNGNDDENEAKIKTNGKVDDNKNAPNAKEETDPINELRMLLKQHGMDSSKQQLLVPKARMRSPSLASNQDAYYPALSNSKHPSTHSQQSQSLPRTTITNMNANGIMPANEKNSNQQQRYVELLVHNVSHTDLVLSLDAPRLPSSSDTNSTSPASTDGNGNDPYCLCRPRFSAFDAYSQRLVDFLKEQQQKKLREEAVINLPRYERNDETQQPQPSSEKIRGDIPVGFRLQEENGKHSDRSDKSSSRHRLGVSPSELHDLRIRGRDVSRVEAHSSTSLSSNSLMNINAVFFPLLATLMPLWEDRIIEKYGSSSTTISSPIPKQVLILVSGVGQPRNWTHSVKGNSTQQCAELMKIFLKTIFPNLVVLHIHSDTNIFRYDENIAFVKQELLPRVQEYRDAHAKALPYPDEIANLPSGIINNTIDNDRPFSPEWRKSFSITISYADGSPARNSAIQAALRTFKPTYYHFWQLKTFWHESKIVNSDIEVHSFEEMETLPPVESNRLQDRSLVKQVVEEMKTFRDKFTQILSNTSEDSNDIRAFWLRKTHKPVIAILAVQPPNGKVKLYRGTNMEVSMPTGSLCAERNVIGTALADNPSLRRQDLKMIAVLAVPNPKQPQSLTGTGGIPRPQSTNSMSSLMTATIEDESSHGRPSFIPSRKSSLGGEEDWIVQDHSVFTGQHITPNSDHFQPNSTIDSSQSSTPARRIYLYNKPQNQTRKQKRSVVVHSGHDINPLRPCGACNEWLKKLAETNPYFTIVTFTDSACNGVYCSPCEE
uniref:Uncharacterized protein n=1 Tax=Pseudo-nitzschia australis TaxID=44445 RepID=A0A7S4AQE9_9STRA